MINIKKKINDILNINIDDVSKELDEMINSPHIIEMKEIGYVKSVADGIVCVEGILDAFIDEIVTFENGVKGIVKELDQVIVKVVLFDNMRGVNAGMKVSRTKQRISVGVGEEILGRVVDVFGNPVDGMGNIKVQAYMPTESSAPQMSQRKAVRRPMNTGIVYIDSMIPIGRGQRQLIIGDAQTGKTSLAISTIINQKRFANTKDKVICIYVAIGQKTDSIVKIHNLLKHEGAMPYTVIVYASASSAAIQQYTAPYSGCAIAEYFMNLGYDCLVVYDDLSKHSIAYREISRLLKRTAGRDAYPADAFYVHARLLERAACMKEGGSITALPIIETQSGDVSSYIATNVISITDGQIFLDSDLFKRGFRPAVDVGISVSRIGSDAQENITKNTAKGLRIELSRYKELRGYAEFAGSAIGEEQKKFLSKGKKLINTLVQNTNQVYSTTEQAILLIVYNIVARESDDFGLVLEDITAFLNFMREHHSDLMEHLDKTLDITPDEIRSITSIASKYIASSETKNTNIESKL